ncbi:hypothetical protein EDC01DRAFT_669896 [Geopyxis carbonaria]|nr:hypothetical protein EDC01DRAFT_669896 [Geopyxis carbonaria]
METQTASTLYDFKFGFGEEINETNLLQYVRKYAEDVKVHETRCFDRWGTVIVCGNCPAICPDHSKPVTNRTPEQSQWEEELNSFKQQKWWDVPKEDLRPEFIEDYTGENELDEKDKLRIIASGLGLWSEFYECWITSKTLYPGDPKKSKVAFQKLLRYDKDEKKKWEFNGMSPRSFRKNRERGVKRSKEDYYARSCVENPAKATWL